jgi:rRNA maturation RNase YbeY
MRLKVFRIFHIERSLPIPRRKLNEIANLIIKKERLNPKQTINIVFCSNEYIRKINKRFLKKDRFTDVIAFEFNEPDLLGEAYISLERASEQAGTFGMKYSEEVIRLFVHAVIHILGYEHGTKREREKMEKHESEYCILSRHTQN